MWRYLSTLPAGSVDRYYNRDASVIYPPVDTTFFSPDGIAPEGFLLVVSALVPYKRIDLAIEAARLAGLPLRVVGDGPERQRLMKCADANHADVTFLGSLSDQNIRDLYRRSMAVLLPGEEDFGIAPVEAQACGRPVVALARGGALETVIDGVTGVLVREASAEAFAAGITLAAQTRFEAAAIRQHAMKFDVSVFTRALQHAIAHA